MLAYVLFASQRYKKIIKLQRKPVQEAPPRHLADPSLTVTPQHERIALITVSHQTGGSNNAVIMIIIISAT